MKAAITNPKITPIIINFPSFREGVALGPLLEHRYGVPVFINNDGDLADALMYGDTLTAEDLGFPVDSYGFIVVDDEF